MMRLAFDAKRAYHNQTGLGNYSRGVLDAFSRYRPQDELYLCTPRVTDRFLNIDSNLAKVLTPSSMVDKMFPALWRSFSVLNQLESLNLDLYHGLSNELPFGIGNTQFKSIVTIHDLIFMRHPEYYSAIDRFIYTRKVKSACNEADRIIAISNQTKKDIIELLNVSPEKIDVVYQTCDSQFKTKVSEVEKLRVRKKYNLPNSFLLSVGTIETRKNLITVLEALNTKELADSQLVVVGKPTDYLNTVKELICTLGIGERVHFIHDVVFQDLSSVYQQAEMLIYPSLYEGFGIPIIEALYSEIPVITSENGCFKEAGGPNTCYVDGTNPSLLTKSVHRILTDKELNVVMREKGRAFVEKFNDELLTSELVRVYEKVLNL